MVKTDVIRQKVFVAQDGMATFACPECQKVKRMDVSKYRVREKVVKLKYRCSCGHRYPVFLERRRHVRKEMELMGSIKKGRAGIPVIVRDLSMSGMKLKSGVKLPFSPDDRITVEFVLDDAGRSVVKKEVIVRTVFGFFIGVEFLSHEHYDKLGPYLLYSN